MQVILLKDVEKLGKVGDIVKVKDGYGANFLVPRMLAKRVERNSRKFLEDQKRKGELRLKKAKRKAEEFKKKLESISCTIPMAAGEDEKLYGTVTAQMISDAYTQEGIEIDKKQMHLPEHIGKLGVYSVEIKLHPEVAANIKLWVVKK